MKAFANTSSWRRGGVAMDEWELELQDGEIAGRHPFHTNRLAANGCLKGRKHL